MIQFPFTLRLKKGSCRSGLYWGKKRIDTGSVYTKVKNVDTGPVCIRVIKGRHRFCVYYVLNVYTRVKKKTNKHVDTVPMYIISVKKKVGTGPVYTRVNCRHRDGLY